MNALIDSCVLMDALLPFRVGHDEALRLLSVLQSTGTRCFIPSHAWFECTVACLIHYKREPEKLNPNPISPEGLPSPNLEIISLSNDYVLELLDTLTGRPKPDLKSQDMIYFCIARHEGMALITQDRKLRNTARKGDIVAFDVQEALDHFGAN